MSDESAIKKSGVKTEFTEEMKNEVLKCTMDPLYFIKKYVKIQHPMKGTVDFQPYDFQLKLIDAFHNNRFSIGLTARQLGKSLTFQSLISKNGEKIEVGSLLKLNWHARIVNRLERFLLDGIAKSPVKALLWLIDSDHRSKEEIACDDMKKFTHIQNVSFQSDFGHVAKAFRTVPYEAWELKTNTKKLIAADKHRVIREDRTESWLEDLKAGDRIITDSGIEEVVSCKNLNVRTHMYCMEVLTDDPADINNHLYYSDGVLSHNTTCAGAYLLWKALYTPDCTILVVGNILSAAQEILDRIQFSYEHLPDFIRCGAPVYNKRSLQFDNGSKIVCRATTKSAGRGLSISLLYCLGGDNKITVRNKDTLEVQDIEINELFEELTFVPK